MVNTNLNKAKTAKNDEFYTQLADIEKELQHYTEHFKDKVVYCNCDLPDSNFVKYFNENKERLGIKEFYYTWYNKETGKGSFDSTESIELLDKADIVVTNPPFSIFRKFLALMEEYNKKYLIVGNMNAIHYKETFKLIKDGKLRLGITSPKEFVQPDKSIKKFGNICWFTNLVHSKRNEKLILTREYSPVEYPKYDCYDAINVDKIKDIPKDYYGVIGVPITFLDKYNPEQFDIVNCNDYKIKDNIQNKPTGLVKDKEGRLADRIVYTRILIKRK